ncbi:MAG: hypothetical protein PHQ23_06285 [Candidatus Wallbacteria bacterium]|nr:hypothetical protein [Candidatus Wallbacteria bacterium]
MKITRETSLRELAFIVCSHLNQCNIKAVLTGGAAVTIYTHGRCQSYDLDFISFSTAKEIRRAMEKLGFHKNAGRHYTHPETDFFIEFPSPPLCIGRLPITKWAELVSEVGVLSILTPTQCVMDRLAGFYHWNDQGSFDQAVAVAVNQEIDVTAIRAWSQNEGMLVKFKIFLAAYTKHTDFLSP